MEREPEWLSDSLQAAGEPAGWLTVSLLKRVSKTGAQILELEKELEALKTAIKKEGKVSTQGR